MKDYMLSKIPRALFLAGHVLNSKALLDNIARRVLTMYYAR